MRKEAFFLLLLSEKRNPFEHLMEFICCNKTVYGTWLLVPPVILEQLLSSLAISGSKIKPTQTWKPHIEMPPPKVLCQPFEENVGANLFNASFSKNNKRRDPNKMEEMHKSNANSFLNTP